MNNLFSIILEFKLLLLLLSDIWINLEIQYSYFQNLYFNIQTSAMHVEKLPSKWLKSNMFYCKSRKPLDLDIVILKRKINTKWSCEILSKSRTHLDLLWMYIHLYMYIYDVWACQILKAAKLRSQKMQKNKIRFQIQTFEYAGLTSCYIGFRSEISVKHKR